MVHRLNEGHITHKDIEFQLTIYKTYIIMKSSDKSLQLIFEETVSLLTKIQRVKHGIKTIIHNRVKSRLYNKKAE